MANDPILAGAREVLEFALEEMRTTLEGADDAAVNWRPGDADTNSLAVLTTHVMASTRSWLSVATGAPRPERDRDSEFVATFDNAAALLAHFDEMARDCMALIDNAGDVDWGALRTTLARPNSATPTEALAAMALIHAISHLREHEGQIFLTRQLWDQRADA